MASYDIYSNTYSHYCVQLKLFSSSFCFVSCYSLPELLVQLRGNNRSILSLCRLAIGCWKYSLRSDVRNCRKWKTSATIESNNAHLNSSRIWVDRTDSTLQSLAKAQRWRKQSPRFPRFRRRRHRYLPECRSRRCFRAWRISLSFDLLQVSKSCFFFSFFPFFYGRCFSG